MFMQAGFNNRAHKLGVVAQIHRRNWRGWRRAELIEFESGDLAWYGSGGISWGTCADLSFWSFVRLGTLVIGPDKQPAIGRVLYTKPLTIHSCVNPQKLLCSTKLLFKNPGRPFRIEVSISPTFSPAAPRIPRGRCGRGRRHRAGTAATRAR